MIILVVILHAVLGAIFPIGRVATKVSGPLFFTALRMLMAGVIISGILWWRNGNPFKRMRGALWVVISFALTGIYLTNGLEFWALQYIPAAKTSFLYSLSPFAAALFSYFYFQETMTWKKWLGMGIGLAGFFIMILHHAPGESIECSYGALSAAEGAIIIAAIASAIGWIVLRRSVRRNDQLSLLEILGASMCLGGLFCLIHSFLVESWQPIPIFDYPSSLGVFLVCLALALVCSNLIGYPLYTELLKTYTATFLSFAGFIEPLCAALYGWVFLGEVVTIYFFAASVLVIVGLCIFYMEELRQGYIVKK